MDYWIIAISCEGGRFLPTPRFFFFFLLGKTGQTDTKSKEEDRVRNTEYMIDRLTDTTSNMNAFHYASSSFRLATSSMNLMIDVRNQM